MKCSVCGSELPENSKFCIFCGNTVKTATPEQPAYTPPVYNPPSHTPPVQPAQPVYTPPVYKPQNSLYQQPAAPVQNTYTGEEVVVPAKPVKGKKGKKGIAIVAVIAAILAVVVIAGIVVLNIPSVKIPLALSRSINAYADIADNLGLTDALAFLEDEACSESMTLTFEEMNSMLADLIGADLSQLETMGVRVDTAVSLAERRLSSSVALVYQGSDLLSANVGLDDDIAWVSVPKLLQNKYGLNTSTLGKDLVEMGAMENEDDFDRFGFNIFDIFELAKTAKPSEDIVKDFADAAKDLAKELEIEADGSDEIKVNGERIKCSKYDVTIPQDALEDYLDAIEDPMNDYLDQYLDVVEELFRSIGMPEDILAEGMREIRSSTSFDYYIDNLKDTLDYIEDVELELYIKGGYVMAVIYELEVDRESMVFTLNMGGENNYADDFSLTVEMEDYFTFELSSSGNHTGKGGEFTDETELSMEIDGDRVSITSESKYSPKKDKNNFSWELNFNGGDYGMSYGIETEGQLTLGKNKLHMQLDEVSVAVMGADIMTLGLDYSIGEYTDAQSASNVKYINKLTEDEMMAMSEELMANLQTLGEELMEKLPFIEEMLNQQITVYPGVAYPEDEPYYYG